MPCWLELLLGKQAERRITWKLLFSDATVFKCGTVLLIDLVYMYTRLILHTNTAEEVGRTKKH